MYADAHRPTNGFTNSSCDRFTDRCSHSVSKRVSHSFSKRVSERLSNRVADRASNGSNPYRIAYRRTDGHARLLSEQRIWRFISLRLWRVGLQQRRVYASAAR